MKCAGPKQRAENTDECNLGEKKSSGNFIEDVLNGTNAQHFEYKNKYQIILFSCI